MSARHLALVCPALCGAVILGVNQQRPFSLSFSICFSRLFKFNNNKKKVTKNRKKTLCQAKEGRHRRSHVCDTIQGSVTRQGAGWWWAEKEGRVTRERLCCGDGISHQSERRLNSLTATEARAQGGCCCYTASLPSDDPFSVTTESSICMKTPSCSRAPPH